VTLLLDLCPTARAGTSVGWPFQEKRKARYDSHSGGKPALISSSPSPTDGRSRIGGARRKRERLPTPLGWPGSIRGKELRGQHLVVGFAVHDSLQVGPCFPHQLCNLLSEFLDRGTGKLVGGRHEMRNAPLGLFRIQLLLFERLVCRLSVLISVVPGMILHRVGHAPPFLASHNQFTAA
jgi:hypothetical protein